MNTHVMLVTAALLLGACGTSENTNDVPDAAQPARDAVGQSPDMSGSSPVTDRPDVREDTIMVEGTPQIERARLVRAQDDFGLPFSTYVPDGLRVDFTAEDPGASVRFTAAFGGVEYPNAYMQVYVYPPGVERPTANNVITGFVRSRAPGIDEAVAIEEPAWALEALRFSYIGTGAVPIVGRVLTGQHSDRYFHVITHYPAEYGDGMGPRVDYILRHWRWEDTGAMLVS